MQFERKSFSNAQLVQMYRSLVYPRLIEEKMLVLLRQGKISKWFSGIGQEAIAVGAALSMQQDEWILPLHRNLGVFTTRKLPLHKLFNQWEGNQNGYTKGRERSFHFGSREHHICGMISHLGPQLAVANGVALAHQLKSENKATLVFTGEGGTSEGDFHEALNMASVWDLPVIFLIENNGYALSTPTSEQYRCIQLADRAKGYGMESVVIDGNNILSVYETIKGVRAYCIKNQKPYLIECTTFRMRGHEEASGTKYIPQELFALWEKKDPVLCFEKFLMEQRAIDEEGILKMKEQLSADVEQELALAKTSALPVAINAEAEAADIFVPHQQSEILLNVDENNIAEKKFIAAIKEALHQALKENDRLIVMGQDIAAYGGAFKVTEGLFEIFGKDRIRNTPICESAVIGAALGLSLEGYKSVVELQFADFVSMGFNQIVNNLAKAHYRWGQQADVVLRLPTGGGVGAGPFHSQSTEAWFAHVPGLKIVYPSTPRDAKGLLIAAINDPNPVLFFEHKALYRSLSDAVPNEMFEVEIGKARFVQRGDDVSIITYGLGVIWAEQYAASHPDISIEILDLRTLAPLDYQAIEQTAAQTGKVLVLHEDTLTAGIGAEVAAWIGEHCFNALDAPVMRCASFDTPVPFNKDLEANFMAESRLDEKVRQLINY
ncbi:dehydrogenase E1 component subunit alpha/beta [Niabella insulamsoli]|uniref:alpha-ketoacid dehydrogenase subunit alpha/beta n=1 Tax=Niabella insulamsoli TaxID=3144874 RepID=UPI0031FC75A6